MNKTLRIALCGLEGEVPAGATPPDEDEGQMIVMNGPLGEVMTKALNIAFAKKDKVMGTVSMESQANDAILALAAAKASAGEPVDGAATAAKSLQANMASGSFGVSSAIAINVTQATPKAIATYAAAPLPDNISDARLKNRRQFVVIDLDGFTIKPGEENVVFAQPNFNDGKSFQNLGVNMTAVESFCESIGLKMVYGVEGLIRALQE